MNAGLVLAAPDAATGAPISKAGTALPAVRGSLRRRVPLAERTWFRVGGPADLLFEPADADDLAAFLAGRPAGMAVTVLGLASNMIVRDGGIGGVTIRLPRSFAAINVQGSAIVAGAGASDVRVARAAQQAGLAGFEFLCGIPGSIGGAVRMNAGAYGADMSDLVEAVEAVDGTGQRHMLTRAELGFAYRHSDLPGDWIVVRAWMRGRSGAAAAIAGRMERIRAEREASQPVRSRTGGSTFANPPGGPRAWELIAEAGCRGLRRGGAQVSERHANFLINTGTATAADLEDLGEEVRERVATRSGITLRWEIRRVGRRGGMR